jgi:DDE family transposase
MYHHNQQPLPWRHWLKWLVVVDLHRQLVLAQKAHAGPTNDGANLRPLVDTAQTVSAIGLVLADAEFDSELNHTHIRQRLGARSVIPAKRGKKNLAHPRRPCPDAKPLPPVVSIVGVR